ncbi:hypothetical protein D3C85_1168820 [compost metagenome]
MNLTTLWSTPLYSTILADEKVLILLLPVNVIAPDTDNLPVPSRIKFVIPLAPVVRFRFFVIIDPPFPTIIVAILLALLDAVKVR